MCFFHIGKDGETFNLHQVTVQKSPLLRAAVHDARYNGHIYLRSVPANAFSDITRWLYCGELPQPAGNNTRPADALPYIRLHLLAEQLQLTSMETYIIKVIRSILKNTSSAIQIDFLTKLVTVVYENSRPDSLLRGLLIRMIAYRISKLGQQPESYHSCFDIKGFKEDLTSAISSSKNEIPGKKRRRHSKEALDPCADGQWIVARKLEQVGNTEEMFESGFLSFS